MPRTFDRRASPSERSRQVIAAAVDLVLKLRAAKAGDTIHGEVWRDGMLRHYERRVEQLLSQAGPQLQRFVREQRKRLRTGVQSASPRA